MVLSQELRDVNDQILRVGANSSEHPMRAGGAPGGEAAPTGRPVIAELEASRLAMEMARRALALVSPLLILFLEWQGPCG